MNKFKKFCKIRKENYYIHGNEVVCVLINAHGKRIRATAKCNVDDGDTFNEETGKKIAKARALQKMYEQGQALISSEIEAINRDRNERLKRLINYQQIVFDGFDEIKKMADEVAATFND